MLILVTEAKASAQAQELSAWAEIATAVTEQRVLVLKVRGHWKELGLCRVVAEIIVIGADRNRNKCRI